MKLSDLKTGYVVTLRDGNRMMVIRDMYLFGDSYGDVFIDWENKEWDDFEAYNEDTMECIGDWHWDIMKVEELFTPFDEEGYALWVRDGVNED